MNNKLYNKERNGIYFWWMPKKKRLHEIKIYSTFSNIFFSSNLVLAGNVYCCFIADGEKRKKHSCWPKKNKPLQHNRGT